MQQAIKQLDIESFITQSHQGVVIDVRTPAEYRKGHIPGSYNIPLFSDEERVEVGTTYVRIGKDEAIELGLELVGHKMASIVRQAKEIAKGLPVYIYCWRGGMRSGSVGWLLQTAGMKVFQLVGGYKRYRRHFNDLLANHPWQLINLGGRTGSGKTEVLLELQQRGEQVIDLEGLANHRGSVYGGLGFPPQPTTEHFENLLHHQMLQFNPSQRIWVECESQSIGSCFITDAFYALMQKCLFINMMIPREHRIQRLVRDYAGFPKEALEQATLKIKKRLGGLVTQQIIDAIEQGNFATVADLTLHYYDKSYDYGFKERESATIVLEFNDEEPSAIAEFFINQWKREDTINSGTTD